MKILITGVTGLLGEKIAERFSRHAAYHVCGIARRQHSELKNVHYTYGDLTDETLYGKLPSQIDICIHCAASMPANEDFQGQRELVQTNILGTLELVKFLSRNCAHTHFIHASTIYVYKPNTGKEISEDSELMPNTFYGLSKLYSEMLVIQSGLKNVILRFSSFYDNEGRGRIHQPLLYDWIERAKRNQDLTIFGTGDEKRNYIHIEDSVNAIEKVLHRNVKGEYIIASDDMLTTYEIAKTIINQLNSKSRIIIDSNKNFYGPFREISVKKASDDFGFKSSIELKHAVGQIASYLK